MILTELNIIKVAVWMGASTTAGVSVNAIAGFESISFEALFFIASLSAVAAVLGQLRTIAKGLPSWKSFLAALLSGAISGFVLGSFLLANKIEPYYILGSSVIVGSLGSIGLDILQEKSKSIIGKKDG